MKTKDIVNIALFATLLAVCAWICIPTAVPFTMQTFAVFLAMLVLGGKKGTIVISIYLLLGAIGLPVFSRGTAGIGILFGSTGGYMMGWILLGLIMIGADKLCPYSDTSKRLQESLYEHNSIRMMQKRKCLQIAGLIFGLFASYLFGTWWFMTVYVRNGGSIDWMKALGICVLPFIIPDLVKLWMAVVLSKRIRKIVGNI